MTMPSKPNRPNHQAFDWQKAHSTPIQIRYADLDTLGHVNNVAYLQYAELSRINLNAAAGLAPLMPTTPIVRMEIDYLTEVKLGQELEAKTLITHIGNTSFTMLTLMLCDQVPCTVVRTVMVNTDQHMRPTPISPQARQCMANYLCTEEQ